MIQTETSYDMEIVLNKTCETKISVDRFINFMLPAACSMSKKIQLPRKSTGSLACYISSDMIYV